jgi:RNA polymerase sigma-70 factor (ECF subfamily)
MVRTAIDLNRRADSIVQRDISVAPLRVAYQHRHSARELDTAEIERVYRYVLVNARDVDVAQDLTSETMLAAVEQRNHFRGDSTISAWLMGIARHKIADHFRVRRNRVSLSTITEMASNVPSPADLAEQRWQLDQIANGLRRLTRDRANALTLYVFGQLIVEEVARVLGKKATAVRMLIYRAIQDLREILP